MRPSRRIGSRIAAKFAELEAEHIAALEREDEKSAAIEAGRIADLDELEKSALRTFDVDSSTRSRSKREALRIAGSRKGSSGGGSRGRRRRKPPKPLRQRCPQCGRPQTADVVVCTICGASLESDLVERQHRQVILWREHADLLERSPEIRLTDVIGTLFDQPRWKNGDVAVWASAFREWQKKDRDRGPNERGRGWRFGLEKGVTQRIYLRRSMIWRLTLGGVDMKRGRNPERAVDLTVAANMAVELFIASAQLLGFEDIRGTGVSRDDFVVIRDALRAGCGTIG